MSAASTDSACIGPVWVGDPPVDSGRNCLPLPYGGAWWGVVPPYPGWTPCDPGMTVPSTELPLTFPLTFEPEDLPTEPVLVSDLEDGEYIVKDGKLFRRVD